ncbi:MAG: heavy metal-binding domain-containing protein [Ginsengibacter sp.]
MMSDQLNCPSCGTVLKKSAFSNNELLSNIQTQIVNEYTDDKKDQYCNKCGNHLYVNSKTLLINDIDRSSDKLSSYIGFIPLISIQNPPEWKYDILKIVTAQSVTGAGAFTEFAATFAELMGTQSNRYNNKIKGGENICFTQLRKNALDAGGNAVIGIDIDYSEIGGDRGMIMVCMTGTAIHLTNIDILGEQVENIYKAQELIQRIRYLLTLKTKAGIE